MEKSKEIYTLPAEFGWSDLGSWGSLRTLLPQDEEELRALTDSVIGKLAEMTDGAFSELELYPDF